MFEDDSELTPHKQVRGRGTGDMTQGRFERYGRVYAEEEAQQYETEVFRDASRTILSTSESPDIGFHTHLNPYRGCEHGCIYCYARPTHEYLGLSAGLDFETKIFAKLEAPTLLRQTFDARNWQPRAIGMSGVTDCYQPVERKLKLTRACLEVFVEYRNPLVLITKNFLITRDIDLLAQLAQYQAVHVTISLTSLKGEIARTMEPRASRPELRLKAIETLHRAGIPVSVNMCPVVPGLTDAEIPALLEAAAQAGAHSAHYNIIRLPYSVKDLFAAWLEQHFPNHKEKVLNRLREMRGGKLYKAEFGSRMTGEGIYADHIANLFTATRKRLGLDKPFAPLSTRHFRRASSPQLMLL